MTVENTCNHATENIQSTRRNPCSSAIVSPINPTRIGLVLNLGLPPKLRWYGIYTYAVLMTIRRLIPTLI